MKGYVRGNLRKKWTFWLIALALSGAVLVLTTGCDQTAMLAAEKAAEAPSTSGTSGSGGATGAGGATVTTGAVPDGSCPAGGSGKSGLPPGTAPGTDQVAKLPQTPAQIAVQCALSKKGAQYEYGAVGPNTFDCSGLVLWAYKQAGLTLPRVANDQAKAGSPVAKDQIQPGDLIPNELQGGVYQHIVMAIGDGKGLAVQAPHTGAVVETTPLAPFLATNGNNIRRISGPSNNTPPEAK
ncbi:MAG: C40 family peptidase [Candidatus Dormibacteraceae bacterium]